MTVIVAQERCWAGDMTRLPDGTWYLVYQRDVLFPGNDQPTSVAWGRTAPDLLAPIEDWGHEEHIHGDATHRAFDPGVTVLDAGSLGITYSSIEGEDGCWFLKRTVPGGVLTPPSRIDGCWQGAIRVEGSAEALDTAECTFFKVLGRWYAVYNARPTDDRSHWQVRSRQYKNGVWLPFSSIGEPSGTGPTGDQKRVTLAATGNAKEVVAAWGAPLRGESQTRTLVLAKSTDSGKTYGPLTELLTESVDLVNPYLLRRDPDLFLFFTRNPGVFAYLKSTDKGASWSGPFDVPLGPHQRNVSRAIVADQDGVLVCFSAYAQDGINTLGTFIVDV